MTMSEERMKEILDQVRKTYHVPPETPREEMWRTISAGLGESSTSVVDLAEVRQRRSAVTTRWVGWGAAAAAVLVMGVGIGRMTAPAGSGEMVLATEERAASSFGFAEQEHLGRTESLLTMVRADARNGRIDPSTARWARGLLSQTRLLMDAQRSDDPAVMELLEDLELLLIQIAGFTETESMSARTLTELDLALRGLEQGGVLPRIRAALPTGISGT